MQDGGSIATAREDVIERPSKNAKASISITPGKKKINGCGMKLLCDGMCLVYNVKFGLEAVN